MQEAKQRFWDEEEEDLKHELVLKRLIASYKNMRKNITDKDLKKDDNSYKNIMRIMNGDDFSTDSVKPKDYDSKKTEIFEKLTT